MEFEFISYYKSLSNKEIFNLYSELIKLGVKKEHLDGIFIKEYNLRVRKEKLEKLCLK